MTEMALAERCALLLWQGTDYETGKTMEVSDAEFLAEYALACDYKRRNPQSPFQIDETSLRRLIRVGKLKAMYRSTNPLDFANGLAVLEGIVQQYHRLLSGSMALSEADFAEQISLDFGRSFVTWTRVPTRNGNYRLAFASRVLTYSFPLLPIFNFSNGVASKLRFQSRPQAALPHYFKELANGLVTNQQLIFSLTPPHEPSGMSVVTWQGIIAKGWWQRRVLDIALLLRLGITKAVAGIVNVSHGQHIGSGRLTASGTP
jgi:hypothetical protein